MASQNLKQRIKEDPPAAVAGNNVSSNRAKKLAMARGGLKSLSVAIVIPLSLTILTAYFSGRTPTHRLVWLLPAWAFHFASLSTSCLMGLSSWLVWADGGFHQKPAALSFYLAQLGLGLAWGPTVLRLGAVRVGLALCAALIAAVYGCYKSFKRANPIAGDLVKPCLVWAGFLGVVNFMLL